MQDGEVVERASQVAMVGPQDLLADRQRPAIGRERFIGTALVRVHHGEVV
jgi:hypothetical protein